MGPPDKPNKIDGSAPKTANNKVGAFNGPFEETKTAGKLSDLESGTKRASMTGQFEDIPLIPTGGQEGGNPITLAT